MVGKPNVPPDCDDRDDLMGSAVLHYQNALDQERAASMADEGGASGAHTDVFEEWPLLAQLPARRSRLARLQPWLLRIGVLGLAAFATALWLRRRA